MKMVKQNIMKNINVLWWVFNCENFLLFKQINILELPPYEKNDFSFFLFNQLFCIKYIRKKYIFLLRVKTSKIIMFNYIRYLNFRFV